MKCKILFFSLALCGASHAQEWSIVYTGEYARNLDGGIETDSTWLGNLDITAEWRGLHWLAADGTAFIYVLGNHGESPSEFIGDAQTFSNIDAPKSLKLYEAWYEQPFQNGAISLKTGLIDLNSEFDVIESAGVFQNSSFGIGPDFSQSGENGPSIFPTTSLGIRVAVQLAFNTAAQCILLDAVSGDPDNPRGTHIDINSDDGALLNCEAAWKGEVAGDSTEVAKVTVGLWQYSESTERLDGTGTQKNSGAYLLGEKTVWTQGDRSLNVFARVGIADDSVNPFAHYSGAGVVLNGVFNNDQLGLGVASVDNGGDFLVASENEGVLLENRETAYELVYRTSITDWMAIQPGLQFIENPGMDPELDNATAVALRFEFGTGGEF